MSCFFIADKVRPIPLRRRKTPGKLSPSHPAIFTRLKTGFSSGGKKECIRSANAGQLSDGLVNHAPGANSSTRWLSKIPRMAKPLTASIHSNRSVGAQDEFDRILTGKVDFTKPQVSANVREINESFGIF